MTAAGAELPWQQGLLPDSVAFKLNHACFILRRICASEGVTKDQVTDTILRDAALTAKAVNLSLHAFAHGRLITQFNRSLQLELGAK